MKAGIVNITGRTGYDMASHWLNGAQANPSGPFYSQSPKIRCMHPQTCESELSLSFDASRVNSIYGGSNTVTPLSRRTVFLVKY